MRCQAVSQFFWVLHEIRVCILRDAELFQAFQFFDDIVSHLCVLLFVQSVFAISDFFGCNRQLQSVVDHADVCAHKYDCVVLCALK